MVKAVSEDTANAINAILSKKLAQVREERGISKRSLADTAGIDRATVRFIEDPEENPTVVNLLRYAMALDLDVGQLLSECLGPHLKSTSGEPKKKNRAS